MDRLCRSTKLYTVEQKFYSLKPLRWGCYHQEAVYQSAFIKSFAELSFGIFWSTENQIVYVYRAVAKKKAHTPLKKGHIVQFRPLWKSLLLKLVFITLPLANFIPLALPTNCAFLSFYSSRIKLCEQVNRSPEWIIGTQSLPHRLLQMHSLCIQMTGLEQLQLFESHMAVKAWDVLSLHHARRDQSNWPKRVFSRFGVTL